MKHIEPNWQSDLINTGDRRPRRSRMTLGIKPFSLSAYEHGGGGTASSTKSRKRQTEDEVMPTIKPSRFPAILAGFSVDYDRTSGQFIIAPIGNTDGHSQSYHFPDLPQQLRKAIQHLK